MGATSSGFVPHADVDIFAGSSRILEFTIIDDGGGPYTITDARWDLVSNGVAIVTKLLGVGITDNTSTTGTLDVVLNPADTVNLCGTYQSDLDLTYLGGQEEPSAGFGQVRIRRSEPTG